MQRGGRSVLVTGASRGFGALIAAALAARGWQVFAAMRNPGAREELDAALTAAGARPDDVHAVRLDVLDSDSVVAGVADVLGRTGGRLDAVVPSAGVAVVGSFEDTPPEAVRLVLETNYLGVAETVRAALPALRAARGRIVLISSDSGLYGAPALSAYTASKFALEGWAESLAYEVAPLGVRVSLVEAGAFRTGIWAADVHRAASGPYAKFGAIAERVWRETGRTAPAPDPVVRMVLAVLDARKPALRHPVGAGARRASITKRLLPHALFALFVRRAAGMARWRP